MLCFTFDLGKTQLIPYINTSVVFYKRQLWFYNLGINLRSNNEAYMCVWEESEGKRDSNEIGSAILSFIDYVDLDSYDKVNTLRGPKSP